jgi:hypothetical protein
MKEDETWVLSKTHWTAVAHNEFDYDEEEEIARTYFLNHQ